MVFQNCVLYREFKYLVRYIKRPWAVVLVMSKKFGNQNRGLKKNVQHLHCIYFFNSELLWIVQF